MPGQHRGLDLRLAGHVHDRRGHRLLRFGGGDVAAVIGAALNIKQVVGVQRLGPCPAGDHNVPDLHVLILVGQRRIFQQVDIFQRDLVGIFLVLLEHRVGLHIVFAPGDEVFLRGHHLHRHLLAQLCYIFLGLVGQLKGLLRGQVDGHRIAVGDVDGQDVDQHQRHHNQKGGRAGQHQIFLPPGRLVLFLFWRLLFCACGIMIAHLCFPLPTRFCGVPDAAPSKIKTAPSR